MHKCSLCSGDVSRIILGSAAQRSRSQLKLIKVSWKALSCAYIWICPSYILFILWRITKLFGINVLPWWDGVPLDPSDWFQSIWLINYALFYNNAHALFYNNARKIYIYFHSNMLMEKESIKNMFEVHWVDKYFLVSFSLIVNVNVPCCIPYII